MKLKVFRQKFVGMVGFPAISPNVSAAWRGAGILPTKAQTKYKFQINTNMSNEETNPASCKTVVSGSVLDSVNDSEYYYLGRKIMVQQNFTKKENIPFNALYQAQSYLEGLGYSYGSLAVTSSPNVAVKKGEYDLPQKWHNLDKEEIDSIDGVIRSLDYREGQVTVMLFN